MDGVNFLAYPDAWFGAVVSCADLDGDGIDEILTGPGPDPAMPAWVRGWNVDGGEASLMPEIDFLAWDSAQVSHGATVAGTGW
jgi:hypothetical protein